MGNQKKNSAKLVESSQAVPYSEKEAYEDGWVDGFWVGGGNNYKEGKNKSLITTYKMPLS